MPALAIIGLMALLGPVGYVTAGMVLFAALSDILFVSSYLQYQNAKGKQYDLGKFFNNGYLANTRSSEEVIPVIYGRYRVGGNQVDVRSTGANNKYIHIVMGLSEGPIEGIETIYLDDKPSSDYGGLVYYEFFNGAGDQPLCTTLQAADANWNDYQRYTAYLYIRLEYDADKFQSGLPKISVVAKGRKLYDPRSGLTVYSNNPALVWYDFMTNKRYGLGIGTSFINTTSVIDAANWCETQTYTVNITSSSVANPTVITTTAAHYLTTGNTITIAGHTGSTPNINGSHTVTVTGSTTFTIPVNVTVAGTGGTFTAGFSYTFNGILNNRQAFLDNLADIMVNFRGDTIWSEGKYKILIRKYETPVMKLTEDEIVADSFTFAVPGTADTPNRVIAKYAEENSADPDDLGWIIKDQTVEDTNAVLTYELEERDMELPLIGTTNVRQANFLAIYNLERNRLNKTFSFVAHPKVLSLEPGDMIDVTHTLPGWTDAYADGTYTANGVITAGGGPRPVRIMDMGLTQDGLVSLTVMEEETTLYDDTLNITSQTHFSTNLPNTLAVPDEATNISYTEEEYYNKDVSYTRLKITYTEPTSPFWSYCEVWVNIDNAGYNHYTDVTGSFYIQPVKEGVSYKIKLLSVSINGNRASISTATEWSHNVIGHNTLPPDVTNFRAIPQSDTIILMWNAVNIVDLQGYEIRKGTNWGGGIFLGFTRALTFQLNGVAPGSHSYMLKSVDTNAKYSNNFALATTTVYGPASYTEQMSEANDFSTPATWAASTAYSLGNKVIPTTPNNYYYKCTTAGTSAATQPTWPTSNGGTVTDNTVVWTCYSAQVFSNTERYNDPTYGWLLRVYHTGGLSGTYTSPVYDRASSVTRRSWPNFDNLFLGTGTAWVDQFTSTELWTDEFSGSDTWLTLFGAYIAGTLKMRLAVSTNGTSWTWFDNFESYVIEAQGRYVKYEISITDVDTSGYLTILPMTYKEAYWS